MNFLLDQVTSLRISKVTGGVTAVTVPTVSLSSTIPALACSGAGVQSPQASNSAPQHQVGTVQVSLSQAPTLTAVSLSTMTMQPQLVPATSMAPTMSPCLVPSIAPVQNMASAMSMSGASGHLVSYPIMSQPTLRTQLQ